MPLLEAFTPSTNPLGHAWASALVAGLPVIAMLVTLGLLRWKAHWAGIFSWGVALLVAIVAFRMPAAMVLSTSLQGFLYGVFPIVWILLAAIWYFGTRPRKGQGRKRTGDERGADGGRISACQERVRQQHRQCQRQVPAGGRAG